MPITATNERKRAEWFFRNSPAVSWIPLCHIQMFSLKGGKKLPALKLNATVKNGHPTPKCTLQTGELKTSSTSPEKTTPKKDTSKVFTMFSTATCLTKDFTRQ